ncbi:MAG: flagellar protein FliS [Lachnospiraceae bacterium]|nr:flagellar protein FliS [Lachnospiraceae bacterium]
MTDELKQEFTLRITQANSTELVVILYEMLDIYLGEGELAHANGDRPGFREAIRKSRAVINELLHSLNLNYTPAPELMQLYLFCIKRLAVCEVKNEADCFDEIRKIIIPLKEAYSQISTENKGGPVMNNSEAIYSGLTYGKNQMTVDAPSGASFNRGYKV